LDLNFGIAQADRNWPVVSSYEPININTKVEKALIVVGLVKRKSVRRCSIRFASPLFKYSHLQNPAALPSTFLNQSPLPKPLSLAVK
jgi:hypothetical protein